MTRLSGRRRQPSRGRADLARLRQQSEAAIARTSPPELADLPVGFWDEPELLVPQAKRAISLRVDADVLAWFKAHGPRYQSRMNAVLRGYMAHMRKRKGRKGAA